ncbi:hypothetical protein D9M68_627820 [compost metagenome]
MIESNLPFKLNPKYDFLLIHYSILERAYAGLSQNLKMKQDRKEWIEKVFFEKYKESMTIVIVSGRGNVKDLPAYVRFVNLSAITTALKEIKSKYLIHQIVYSSRNSK